MLHLDRRDHDLPHGRRRVVAARQRWQTARERVEQALADLLLRGSLDGPAACG